MNSRGAPRTAASVSVWRTVAWALAAVLVVAGGWLATRTAWATPTGTSAISGPPWSSLTPAQQEALAPLQPTWNSNDAARKKKWIEVADRFPRMPADERRRVQERMADWAALTPAQRAQARMQFQEARRISPEERQARWQAYQALPEDERKRLAQSAQVPAANSTAKSQAPSSMNANGAKPPSAPGPVAAARAAKPAASAPKTNVVAAQSAPPLRSVAPTMVQAKPGASTTTVTTAPKPPLHHQPGLPKIASTPTFVDPNTLLPRRGPQAAAMRTAASSDPTQQP